jgi:hypothetical protein
MDGNLEDDESSREERYRKKWEAVFIYPALQQKIFLFSYCSINSIVW